MLDNIIKYEELEDCDAEYIQLKKVIFLKDFGPWKAGYKTYLIELNYTTRIIQEFDTDGEWIKSCEVELIPAKDSSN